MQGPARDSDDTLFAAKLYGAIADISIKVSTPDWVGEWVIGRWSDG